MKFKNAKMWESVKSSKLFLVDTMEDWKSLIAWLVGQPIFAADTETSGFNYFLNDRIVGMSFGWGLYHAYVPVRHENSVLGGQQPRQLVMEDLLDDLKFLFSDRGQSVVGHNIRFDQHFYRVEGVEIKCRIEDTMLKWVLYDENAPAALKDIASGWRDSMGRIHKGIVDSSANEGEKLIGQWRGEEAAARRKEFTKIIVEKTKEASKEIAFQGWKLNDIKKHFREEMKDHPYATAKKEDVHYGCVPIDIMAQYAAMDTFLTCCLYIYLSKSSKFHGQLADLYENELKLSATLLDLEENGIKCDREYLISKGIEFGQKIKDKEAAIQQILGPVNLNSSVQLLPALQAQGIQFTKLTDKGKIALDKKVLKKLASKHIIVKEILLYRSMMKLKNTYFDSILAKLTPSDYCHTSFNQNVKTGRMSSKSPNFTNIPRGDLVRNVFICPEDYTYILADYSQIEVRLTAHYSQDPLLLEAYRTGQDVHTRTMSEVFGPSYEEAVKILKDENHPNYSDVNAFRTVCKIVNFGVIYGVSPIGLSEQIPRPAKYADLDEDEWVCVCEDFVNDYFLKYKGVKRFVDKYSYLTKQQGYVVNHFGRVRHLPEVNIVSILKDKKLFWREKRAQRQGVNCVIQGSAADMFKIALTRINSLFKEHNAKSRLINTVHDEVQLYLHKDEHYLLPKIKHCMEDFQFDVPIVADFSYSKSSWANKKSLEV